MAQEPPIVVLFGYDASPFTTKVRLCLIVKRIPYKYIQVPSMMPRPMLKDNFGITYRKIPVLAIGKEIYCDTSLIVEALEHFFPDSEGYQSLFPAAADGRTNRPMIRGFASYWVERPFFRVTTGLIPASVWRTSFGQDRSGLIGHALDPDKLEKKVPENLSRLDMQLSIMEPMFTNEDAPWIFSTSAPSLADISIFTQLSWGSEIAKGHLIDNLTGGGTSDTSTEGASAVFNAQRYPGVWTWFKTMQQYIDNLESVEDKDSTFSDVLEQIKTSPTLGRKSLLLPTPRNTHAELDAKCGLSEGATVSVAPDDTGRDDPTIGTLLAMSPEEMVIKPRALEKAAEVEVRIHFPRLGFVIRPVDKARL
jgi:glutathione S-transferase